MYTVVQVGESLSTALKMMKLLVFSEGQHVHCCIGWRKLKYC